MRGPGLALLLGLALAVAPAAAQETLPAPTGLRVEVPDPPEGTRTLVVRWNPVPGAYGYEVYELRNGAWFFNDADPERIPVIPSARIRGLRPDTPYEFKVRAVAGPGVVSPMSEPAGGRTLAPGAPKPAERSAPVDPGFDPAAPPPPPPSGLIAVFGDGDVVRLVWRTVEGAAGYRVEEQGEDGSWREVSGDPGRPLQNRTDVPNRPPPGPFRYRVRSVGANGRLSDPTWPVTVER